MEDIHVPRELHGKKKIGYVIGNFGIFLNSILIYVFITNYYIYTINLDSIIVLIGFSLQQIAASLFSIVFGVLADNKKPGKLGKRRPFLLYGLPIWALTSILIWIPPTYCPRDNSICIKTGFYFWFIGTINLVLAQSILSPHASMLPEQSQTLKNREDVNSINTLLVIIASIIGMILPLIVKSLLDEPNNVAWWTPSGQKMLFFMPMISFFLMLFGILSILITFFSVDESFHDNSSKKLHDKKSIKTTFKQMTNPARDKGFRRLFSVSLMTNIAGSIMGFVIIPFLDYVMLFHGSSYFIYIIISITNKFIWFYIWSVILKRKSLIFSYKRCIFISAIASISISVFLINTLSFEIKLLLFIVLIGTLLGLIYAFRLFTTPLTTIFVSSAAKKSKSSNIDKSVAELSGSYFGFINFTFSFGSAFANIFLAFVFTGANKSNSIIIILVFSSISTFYIISYLYLSKIKIKEE
ncbi:MAG: MFS transporter [Promethearchaeota archaeon]